MDFWLGTPLLNFLATFRFRRKPPTNPQRFGVMCSPALGDTLLFSGVLLDLRTTFPAAHITHICMQQNLAAAEILSGADARIVISLTDPRATIAALREQHFDVLLDFTSWQRLTAFYTIMSGAKFTVGFLSPGQRRSRGYDRTVPHRRDLHELDNFRALLDGSGLLAAGSKHHEPAVTVPSLSEPIFASEQDIVAFHLWVSGQNSWLREWPDERWVALAQRIARLGTLFLITGAPSDRVRSEPFVQKLLAAGLRAESYVSPDGFATLTHLLRRARVVVSVNTGVMHLAAVAGAPTVSLNGPTAEHRWGARGPRVANVQPADGSGGYLHFGFEFEGQPEDIIERITVDQVVAACATVEVAAERR